MAETLYEGQTASHLLGRAHFHYKDISFGRIRERFEKFYRYSNCLIVLYGKMDVARILDFLDREHLSRFSAADSVDNELLSYFHEPVNRDFSDAKGKVRLMREIREIITGSLIMVSTFPAAVKMIWSTGIW